MKKLLPLLILFSSALSHADSIGVLDCFSQKQQLSISIEYYPDDVTVNSNIPLVAQVIQNTTGAVKASGNELYSNYDNITVVTNNKTLKIYQGPKFKLTVFKSPSSTRKSENGYSGINRLARIQATTENKTNIDTYIRCDM